MIVGHVGVDSRKILTTFQTPAYHTYLCPDTIHVTRQRPSRITLRKTERSELSSEKPYGEGRVSRGDEEVLRARPGPSAAEFSSSGIIEFENVH